MELTPLITVAGISFSAGASFLFSLAETALFSLSNWQVRQLAERSPHVGGKVARLLASPQDLLATIALGNTFAGAAMLALGLWMALGGQWPLPATLFGVLILTLLAGEVLPKTLAVRSPENWALRVARTMSVVQWLTWPLRRVAQKVNAELLHAATRESVKPLPAHADEDYRELLELAFQHGALAQSEKEIILQIISLDRRAVREVMRPRSQMAAIPDDLSVADMIAAARENKHRRLPMFDETPDTIVGVLNTRALLLHPEADLADVIEFPSFVPESMNLLQLLKSLQRQKRGLAIVLDEFGGTAGLVTMEDILAQLMGGMRTESEPGGFVMAKLAPGKWRISGAMRLDDFRREYPQLPKVPEIETMGGLLASRLDVMPAAGESAVFHGLKLTAHVADERRVRELIVEVVK